MSKVMYRWNRGTYGANSEDIEDVTVLRETIAMYVVIESGRELRLPKNGGWRGPATNRELASIALKYSSRTSDLRAAGFNIVCERGSDGLTWYRLEDGK